MILNSDLKIPLDADLFDIMTRRVANLESENAYLKCKIEDLYSEVKCDFSITKEPQVIDVSTMNPLMRLGAYCKIEKDHDHRRHVICRILNNGAITFSYYIDDMMLKEVSHHAMMAILGEMHKRLMNEVFNQYMENSGVRNE